MEHPRGRQTDQQGGQRRRQACSRVAFRAAASLVEIPASRFPRAFAMLPFDLGEPLAFAQRAEAVRVIDQFAGDDVDDKSVALDLAAHFQELCRHDRASIACEHVGPDHHIYNTSLVFQRDEDDALSRPGLAHQHEACHAGTAALAIFLPMLHAADHAS
jgi:hypothetical protein